MPGSQEFPESTPTPEPAESKPKKRKSKLLRQFFVAGKMATVLGGAAAAEAPEIKQKPIEHKVEDEKLPAPEFEIVEDRKQL